MVALIRFIRRFSLCAFQSQSSRGTGVASVRPSSVRFSVQSCSFEKSPRVDKEFRFARFLHFYSSAISPSRPPTFSKDKDSNKTIIRSTKQP